MESISTNKVSVYQRRLASHWSSYSRLRKVLIIIAVTLIALVAAAVLLYLIGGALSHRSLQSTARELLETGAASGRSGLVSESDIAHLPDPVQRWLVASNTVGSEHVRTVRLKQSGRFRQSEDGQWMQYEAVEYFSVNPPEFLWRARFKTVGLPLIEVRDSYSDGKGKTEVKIASLIPMGSESGPEADQGDLVRYLNEIMWFPSAALSDYIQWEPIDSNSAEATMTYRDVTASAVFYFDEAGHLVNISADRFGKFGDNYSLERWSTPLSTYREFEGIVVPTEGVGVWNLETGDFPYIEPEVSDVSYNVTEPF